MGPIGRGAELLLPEGTRLVHIGPPKTGTTSLQAAFHAARPSVLAQGVRYAGSSRHSVKAILAVTGRPAFSEGSPSPPPISKWHELLEEIREAEEPRIVLSSEALSYATPAAIRRVVEDLDPSRVHIVATLRPLGRILASAWQEHTQSGLQVTFDDWLTELFSEPPGKAGIAFWHKQRHDELIARWAEVVGPERITVVVLDERDHGMLLRTFERFVGLHEGTLVADPDLANRSLTLPEIRAIQALRGAFEADGLADWQFHTLVRNHVSLRMKARKPSPDEPRVEAPQWALDRAGEIARGSVDAIAASGVRVVGDLESLTVVSTSRVSAGRQPEVAIPPEVAASMAMGILRAPGAARRAAEAPGHPPAEAIDLARIPTRKLAGALARRARATVTRRWRRIRHRIG